MDYFERCKKRIENTKFIGQESDYYTHVYYTDQYLSITKDTHKQGRICNISYTVLFKKTTVPLSEKEKKTLFELCEKIHKEREDAKDKKILEEL